MTFVEIVEEQISHPSIGIGTACELIGAFDSANRIKCLINPMITVKQANEIAQRLDRRTE